MIVPILRHQEILLELGRRFGNHLEGKKCKVFVAPILVIEILSPSNKKYDKVMKLELYEDKTIEVFVLEDGIYSSKYSCGF